MILLGILPTLINLYMQLQKERRRLDTEKIEEKIGEVLGLEMAAQKAVEQLISKGLLDKDNIKTKVEEIRKEAHNHQTQIEQLCEGMSSKEPRIDSEKVKSKAKETDKRHHK